VKINKQIKGFKVNGIHRLFDGKQLKDTVDMLLATTVCFPADEHSLVSILLGCEVKLYIAHNIRVEIGFLFFILNSPTVIRTLCIILILLEHIFFSL